MRRDFFRPFVLAALVVGSPACGPSVVSGRVLVEAIVIDRATDTFVTEVVALEEVVDFHGGEGERLQIAADINYDTVGMSLMGSFDTYESPGDYRSKQRARLDYNPPSFKMHQEGDHWVADDYYTLHAFTAWHAVEEAMRGMESLGAASAAATEPLLVGVQTGPKIFSSPFATSYDNGQYQSSVDAITLGLSFADDADRGMRSLPPLGAQEQVVVHETGHRLFDYLIAEDYTYDQFQALMMDSDIFDERGELILQGVNEGTADLLAAAVTETTLRAFRPGRALDGDYAREVSWSALTSATGPFVGECGTWDPVGEPMAIRYCIGTLFGGTVWLAAGEDMTVFRDVMMPALFAAIRTVGDTLAARAITSPKVDFTMSDVLEPLAAAIADDTLREALCAQIADRYEGFIESGPIPTCAGALP